MGLVHYHDLFSQCPSRHDTHRHAEMANMAVYTLGMREAAGHCRLGSRGFIFIGHFEDCSV
jgi:hypothetical protein